MAGALKAPVDKLPLTTRKNVRDQWEVKKPEYEKTMLEILGVKWTIDVNPNLLYVYANEDHKSRIGAVIVWYMDPFISNLKRYIESFGEDGKQELNTTCSKHVMVLAPQESTTFSYGGLVVEDGALRLVFQEKHLGTNTSNVSKDFAKALQDASPPASGGNPLNIVARNSVATEYDPNVKDVQLAIAKLVNMPNLELVPNFDHNAAALAAFGDAKVWEDRIGTATLSYFRGVQSILEREKFAGDEMLQEAFQEAVEKGQICLRVVTSLKGSSGYNEVIVEDGVLYVQTTPKY